MSGFGEVLLVELAAQMLVRLVNELHVHLSQYPLSFLSPDRPSSRFDALSDRTGPDIARTIDETLQELLQSRDSEMTAFRVSVIHTFIKNDKSWPLIEYTEDNGTRVLAIMALDDDDSPESCSYIMHVIHSSASHSSSLADLTFNVSDFKVMKTLFQVAQHVWGLLQMPREDALILYCETHESSNYSTEKLTKYARLLSAHFQQIEDIGVGFDTILPKLEEVCLKEGIDHGFVSDKAVLPVDNGNESCRYMGSLELNEGNL